MQAVVSRIGTMDRFQVDDESSVPVRESSSVPETGITRHPKTMADQPKQSIGPVTQEVGDESEEKAGTRPQTLMPNLFWVSFCKQTRSPHDLFNSLFILILFAWSPPLFLFTLLYGMISYPCSLH